jgi:hypothetical protein
MEFILTIILGFIFCLPMLWVAKLKTDLEIMNHKLDFYRDQALIKNRILKLNSIATWR